MGDDGVCVATGRPQVGREGSRDVEPRKRGQTGGTDGGAGKNKRVRNGGRERAGMQVISQEGCGLGQGGFCHLPLLCQELRFVTVLGGKCLARVHTHA